jgi:hypothetical protein
LAEIVDEAHEDQRRHLDELMTPLDPHGRPSPGARIADVSALPTTTLQGYLGEILAGIVAENYDPHGREWTVPGFTFRFDQDAETQMIRYFQGEDPVATFGRHGTDCLAFSLDESGDVDAYLACEGKCTTDHRKALIDTGHKQLSTADSPAADVLRLIQVLDANRSSEAARWASILQAWLLKGGELSGIERCDLLLYVCGRGPKPPRESWIHRTTPSVEYTGKRRFEAAEAHVARIKRLVAHCYPGHRPRDG